MHGWESHRGTPFDLSSGPLTCTCRHCLTSQTMPIYYSLGMDPPQLAFDVSVCFQAWSLQSPARTGMYTVQMVCRVLVNRNEC